LAVEVSGEHRFKAPRSVVWEALLDPAALQAAIPGCERFEEVGPDSYDLTIKVGIAAIKGTYSGNVKVADRTPEESYRLIVTGSGKPGSVQGDAVMSLIDDGAGGTIVRYRADVKAQGAIARLGSRLLAGSAKLMIGQFFKGMEKQVEQRVA
jgi:carbon monoxide dehydrogenase subunit G